MIHLLNSFTAIGNQIVTLKRRFVEYSLQKNIKVLHIYAPNCVLSNFFQCSAFWCFKTVLPKSEWWQRKIRERYEMRGEWWPIKRSKHFFGPVITWLRCGSLNEYVGEASKVSPLNPIGQFSRFLGPLNNRDPLLNWITGLNNLSLIVIRFHLS